jgi:hypothetical protein
MPESTFSPSEGLWIWPLAESGVTREVTINVLGVRLSLWMIIRHLLQLFLLGQPSAFLLHVVAGNGTTNKSYILFKKCVINIFYCQCILRTHRRRVLTRGAISLCSHCTATKIPFMYSFFLGIGDMSPHRQFSGLGQLRLRIFQHKYRIKPSFMAIDEIRKKSTCQM